MREKLAGVVARYERWLPLLPIAFALAYGAAFIARTSFVLDGERTYCLFDDAMISMTYARNLVEGHGLNWARWGDPVEGFSHPLWLLPMVVANLLPIDIGQRSLFMQLFGLGLFCWAIWLTYRIAQDFFWLGRRSFALLAATLTASFYPLVYWSLTGLAASGQAVICLLVVWLALRITERGETHTLKLCACFAAALLLRIDMAIVVGVALTWIAFRRRFRGWRRWGLGALIVLGFVGGYEVFRLAYFGDPLPNTYYLKLHGVALAPRVEHGLGVLQKASKTYAPLLALVLGAGAWMALRRHRVLLLPGAVFVAYTLYSVYVGGDVGDPLQLSASRFQAHAFPLFFVGLAAVISAFDGRLAGIFRDPAWLRSDVRPWIVSALTLALILAFNALPASALWGEAERGAAERNLRRVMLRDVPDGTIANYRNVRNLRKILALPPETRVAAVYAGASAYFSDFEMVDQLGFNDREIAHGPVRVPLVAGHMNVGHLKYDHAFLLAERDPDVFFYLWPPGSSGAELRRAGFVRWEEFWVRPAIRALLEDAEAEDAEEEEDADE